ncbi:helix-turn-helix domain-containing protein [Ursidibacter sp. B-7004-1]
MAKINERIRLLREEHLFSQEQMAEKMQLSPNSYGKLERGETKLTLEKLEQIANIFDIDIVELINTGEKNSYQVMHYGTGTNAFNITGENKEILFEIEKLQLIISHKEETIAHQKQEIDLLKQMLSLVQKESP